MDNIEGKLGAILGNPEAMQKIMSLAQNLNLNGESESPPQKEQEKPLAAPSSLPDLSALQKITGMVGNEGIGKNERTLLNALHPYVSHERITKLERAMRAAKLARAASALFSSGMLNPGGGK